jgi:DNA-binding IclR family transcriptional regulator
MSEADRTARVLALVLDRSPREPGDLAAAVAATEVEVIETLHALARHGLVAWSAGQIVAGPRLRGAGKDLAQLAEPAMRRLAAESGETVNLMVRSPHGAEAIAQVDGKHVLGVSSWIGREVPDHCSAAGKVFLAYGEAPPRGPLERLTSRTIVHPAELQRDLDQARMKGYATIVDELEMGLAAVAAPIRSGDGAVVGALSVAGPTARLGPSRLAVVGRLAVEQADAVATALA